MAAKRSKRSRTAAAKLGWQRRKRKAAAARKQSKRIAYRVNKKWKQQRQQKAKKAVKPKPIRPKRGKPKRRPPKPRRDHVIKVKFSTRERGHKAPTTFTRDIIVPAREGTSRRDIERAAAAYLGWQPATFAKFKKKHGPFEIAEGPKTQRKKPEMR